MKTLHTAIIRLSEDLKNNVAIFHSGRMVTVVDSLIHVLMTVNEIFSKSNLELFLEAMKKADCENQETPHQTTSDKTSLFVKVQVQAYEFLAHLYPAIDYLTPENLNQEKDEVLEFIKVMITGLYSIKSAFKKPSLSMISILTKDILLLIDDYISFFYGIYFLRKHNCDNLSVIQLASKINKLRLQIRRNSIDSTHFNEVVESLEYCLNKHMALFYFAFTYDEVFCLRDFHICNDVVCINGLLVDFKREIIKQENNSQFNWQKIILLLNLFEKKFTLLTSSISPEIALGYPDRIAKFYKLLRLILKERINDLKSKFIKSEKDIELLKNLNRNFPQIERIIMVIDGLILSQCNVSQNNNLHYHTLSVLPLIISAINEINPLLWKCLEAIADNNVSWKKIYFSIYEKTEIVTHKGKEEEDYFKQEIKDDFNLPLDVQKFFNLVCEGSCSLEIFASEIKLLSKEISSWSLVDRNSSNSSFFSSPDKVDKNLFIQLHERFTTDQLLQGNQDAQLLEFAEWMNALHQVTLRYSEQEAPLQRVLITASYPFTVNQGNPFSDRGLYCKLRNELKQWAVNINNNIEKSAPDVQAFEQSYQAFCQALKKLNCSPKATIKKREVNYLQKFNVVRIDNVSERPEDYKKTLEPLLRYH